MKVRRTLRRPSWLHRPERGWFPFEFTLIEALVVIVILGILIAVVVFAVKGINEQEIDWEPPTPTTTSTTTPVALLTCEQLDNAGYDGLASCIDAEGNVVGPGR